MRSLRSFRPLRYALALVLLFATAAPALARMTCVMSGHSVVSVGEGKDCCPTAENTNAPVLKPTCCVFTHIQAHRDPFVAHTSLLLPITFTVDHAIDASGIPPSIAMGDERVRITRPTPLLLGQRLVSLGSLLL